MQRAVSLSCAVLTGMTLIIGAFAPSAAVTRRDQQSDAPAVEVRGIVQDIVVEPGARGDARGGERGGEVAGSAAEGPPVIRRVLRTDSGTVPLTGGSLPQNQSGDEVSVTFEMPSAQAAATASGLSIRSSQTRRSASTVGVAGTSPGVRSVYVAFVAPKGTVPDSGLTAAKAVAAVRQASDYWASQSRGLVTFKVAASRGWWTSARSCSEVFALWDEVQARYRESVGSHRHLLMVLPRAVTRDPSCHYGFATVGAPRSGGSVYVSDLNQSLVAHELGHNLGLHHANSLICAKAQDSVFAAGWAAGCEDRPYDDLFDVMGYSGPGFGEGNLNGPHLDVMGLQPEAVRSLPAGTTTALIAPLSSMTSPGRVLRIPDPAGGVYYIEYRTASGRDVYPLRSADRPSAGVRVLRADPHYRYATGSYELDASPSLRWSYQRSLTPGTTFTSASGKVTVTVLAQTAGGARVLVKVAGAPATSAPKPVPDRLTIALPKRAGFGAWVTAKTSVTNPQGAAVAGWGVTLQRQISRKTWRNVASTTTSRHGVGSVRFRNGASGVYRWISAAARRVPSRTSTAVAVRTLAVIRADRVVSTIRRGGSVAVSGIVTTPSSPVVHVQARVGRSGTWRQVARAVAAGSEGSEVRAWVRAQRVGTLWTRLVVAAGAGHLGAISPGQPTVVR